MEHLGFGPKWREWISNALATSSSCILLNGVLGTPIKHKRGLRQGDPLLPMLFILAMDPLQKILQLVIERNLLHPTTPRSVGIKASLYTDDAALFVHSCNEGILYLKEILKAFGDATGCTQIFKKQKFSQFDVMKQIMDSFVAQAKPFPCRYLGIPLRTRKPRKVDFLPLLDKVGGKLPGWKGRLMSKATRAQLVKSVLTSIVTYHTTVFPLPKWLIKKIDKLRRNFLWKEEDCEGNKGAYV
jgi:hypothetical protein